MWPVTVVHRFSIVFAQPRHLRKGALCFVQAAHRAAGIAPGPPRGGLRPQAALGWRVAGCRLQRGQVCRLAGHHRHHQAQGRHLIGQTSALTGGHFRLGLQCDLGLLQELAHFSGLAGKGERPGLRDTQPGPSPGGFLRQAFDPAEQGMQVAARQQRRGVTLHQGGGPAIVAGLQRVVDGFVQEVVRFKPCGSARVQPRQGVRRQLFQSDLQETRKQVVEAEPLSLGVQRRQEQIGAAGLLDQALAHAWRCGRDGLAQRGGEAVQDGDGEQETPQVFRLIVEHFLGQVVQQVALAARQSVQDTRDLGPALEREGRHLQPGRPALQPGVQHSQVLGPQAQARRVREEVGRLGGGEAEIIRAQLHQLAAAR